jgi:hypothetical protein
MALNSQPIALSKLSPRVNDSDRLPGKAPQNYHSKIISNQEMANCDYLRQECRFMSKCVNKKLLLNHFFAVSFLFFVPELLFC